MIVIKDRSIVRLISGFVMDRKISGAIFQRRTSFERL